MRDPTGLLQAQARVIADATVWLEEHDPDAVTDQVLIEQIVRMFVARLTGAPIHAETLQRLHASYPSKARAKTVEAVAAAVNSHSLGGGDFEVHRQAVHGLVVLESVTRRPHDDRTMFEPEPNSPWGTEDRSAASPTVIDALNAVGSMSAEKETAVDFLKSETDRGEAYRSLVWSLLATNEFLFNH